MLWRQVILSGLLLLGLSACDETSEPGAAALGLAPPSTASKLSALPGSPWPRFHDQGVVYENRFQFEGQELTSNASDPSVVYDGSRFVMSVTGTAFREAEPQAIICGATSPDGVHWAPVAGDFGGAVAEGRAQSDAANLEGSALVRDGQGLWLFYSTYPALAQADPVLGFPADLRLDRAIDIEGPFERVADQPLPRSTQGLDRDSVYSPTIVRDGQRWLMAYTGHCFAQDEICGQARGGVSLLFAESSSLVGPWTRLSVDLGTKPDWAGIFVAEAGLLRVDDGYYLFVSGFIEENGQEIPVTLGAARATSLQGPWEWSADPILTRSQIPDPILVAPHPVLVGDRLLLYYTRLGADGIFRVALLESQL